MKVVFFVHCFFPNHFYGTETYTLELAKHYQDFGHEVIVVSAIFQGEPRQDVLLKQYCFQGIPVVSIDKNHLPHSRIKETYYQADMKAVFHELMDELAPDVVHVTHLINHTATLLEVTQARGIPTYATFTDFFGFCLNNKLENARGGLCAGPLASRLNCVACHLKAATDAGGPGGILRYAKYPKVAEAMAYGLDVIRRFPGVCKGPTDGMVEDIVHRPDILSTLYNNAYRAAVAPTHFLGDAYKKNGISTPLYYIHFGVDIDRAAKPVRSREHIPTIGFIGQIAPHKGTDLLLSAFNRLSKGAARLLVYGPADQDRQYMESLERLADTSLIEFRGTFKKESMLTVMADLDLLVIPSRWYENSPLVLLNALATHTPVLVSDVAGMTEFLNPGINGYAFERGNVDSLYQYLHKLVSHPDDLYALTETTNYERTTKNMAQETFELYSI
jgi:glycosyltransferase, family 1